MFWAPPVSHGPDLMGLHDDCSSDAHKHGFPFFCCGSCRYISLEIAKPDCMEGGSTAYFQSDQFWAVDAGLPDLSNQISVLVLFQAVCFFIPCFETDGEFH